VRVALASSSAYRLIRAVTERLGLADSFDCVYSAEEEEYGKPHPGVYLTAARRLGVAPTQCLAVEDSFNGVLAAKAARMKCVAVPEPAQRRDPRFCIADVVLDSLAGVGVEVWRALDV
jgi:sugar-phosphatase